MSSRHSPGSTLARGLAASLILLPGLPAVAQIAPGPGVNPRTVWSDPPETFTSRVVASGFEDPWEVSFGPDGYLWITERIGKRVVRVDPVDGTRKVAVTIDEVLQRLGQDGLLGLALHPDLLRGSNDVYVMYTYDAETGPDEERRAKIRRYRFDPATETLGEPLDILTGLPHGPDHGASRIVFGPDGKLYASRGDHGANFLSFYCEPNRAQELPLADDVAAGNWQGYQGKILRINPDGTIPDDNPLFNGVRSHVFSIGHRNPQGLAFGPDGQLYAAEHGQDTDDEVNRIVPGGNYGWPLIAGFKDDQYYTYANWSASAPTPCEDLPYGREPPASVPRILESEVELANFEPPLMTFFTVPSSHDTRASGNATAALAGLDIYAASAIPGWNPSLLVASLMSGTIYRIPLDAVDEPPLTYFKAQDRYRDLAIAPDGTRIYAVTASYGRTLTAAGGTTGDLEHPGSLLEFTYTGPGSATSLTALDYVEIQQLVNRLNFALDYCGNGGRDFADLFVAGGRFVIDQGNQEPNVIASRDGLIALAGGPDCDSRRTPPSEYILHLAESLVIEPAAGGARGMSYAIYPESQGRRFSDEVAGQLGIYYDSYVRTEDGWRFRSRRHVVNPVVGEIEQ